MDLKEGFNRVREDISNQTQANELLQQLLSLAKPQAVFGEPVTQGEYQVITASEISAGMGYGFGGGGGFGWPGAEADEGQAEAQGKEEVEGQETAEGQSQGMGFGSGGGGGGAVGARPVAVIEIGPNGVRIEPVVDPTKISLAFFTTFGAMMMMFARMRQQAGG